MRGKVAKLLRRSAAAETFHLIRTRGFDTEVYPARLLFRHLYQRQKRVWTRLPRPAKERILFRWSESIYQREKRALNSSVNWHLLGGSTT